MADYYVNECQDVINTLIEMVLPSIEVSEQME